MVRRHGAAGIALLAFGVSEWPSAVGGESHEREPAPLAPDVGAERDAVALVSEQAVEIAQQRGAGGVGTKDLLLAVIRIYGEEFDRVLRAHGTDRAEVLARLTVT